MVTNCFEGGGWRVIVGDATFIGWLVKERDEREEKGGGGWERTG